MREAKYIVGLALAVAASLFLLVHVEERGLRAELFALSVCVLLALRAYATRDRLAATQPPG